jgi:hypothetical protein
VSVTLCPNVKGLPPVTPKVVVVGVCVCAGAILAINPTDRATNPRYKSLDNEVAGREYIAFCVAGGDGMMTTKIDTGKLAVPPGPGAYIVFALPRR